MEKVTPDGRLVLADGGEVAAERLLVATGRTPVTEDLNLAAAGVATDERGFVVTDAYLRTTARGVCVAGDVTGRLLFTHAAYEMVGSPPAMCWAGGGRRGATARRPRRG